MGTSCRFRPFESNLPGIDEIKLSRPFKTYFLPKAIKTPKNWNKDTPTIRQTAIDTSLKRYRF